MECYIKKCVNWRWEGSERVALPDTYKGFPVVSESQRRSAEQWSHSERSIQIPDELTDCGVDDFDDRMNNKIFKVYYNAKVGGETIKVYFDMYVPEMLDLMRHGTIDKEIIKTPLIFGERARLIMKGGAFHKKLLDKEAAKKKLKETKNLATKDLVLGGYYSSTENGAGKYYVGHLKGQGHIVITPGWGSLNKPTAYSVNVTITKSLGFKFKHEDKFVTINDLKEYSVNKRKAFEERIEDVKKTNETRRMNGYRTYTLEVPIFEDEFAILDVLDNYLSSVDK